MNRDIVDMDTMTLSPGNINPSRNTSLGAIMSLTHQSESNANGPEEEECFSTFGNEACGEPMMAQRVVMKFVPDDEDSDEVSKKCCEFWQFVKEHPELNQLMIKAEPKIYSTESTITTTSTSSTSSNSITVEEPSVPDKSAVDMLGFVEDKGLIDRIFEAKLPTRYCTKIEGSREYRESRDTEPYGLSKGSVKKAKYVSSSPIKTRETCDVDVPSHEFPPGPSCPKAVALCTVLEDWDEQHPKSMKQPGHPPCLSHSIMQRKIIY